MPQFERVSELVEDAKKHGAKIVSGGSRLGSEGYFYAPTIVSEISDGVRLVDEEQFGPALPIMPYKDVADAVRRANATTYGLSGSVWGTIQSRRGSRRRNSSAAPHGSISIWRSRRICRSAERNGPGIGVENGPWGLLGFTEIQVVNAVNM